MGFYAHAPIESATQRYEIGALLPDDLPGLGQLVEHGSAGSEPPVIPVAAGDSGVSTQENHA